ncbi:glycosyltransferase family 4 protein [Pedobacter sp. MC2016-15]|uniref:glycosyltransferase family 4 protein n=1 Tax=Pedobacter sp. MC2016-15 TaxID=2994473 RepID=UPI002245AD3F|nr:glycosyltransferase family 4 protein [Pedobacter sp. MC2016-15]MCX2481810.1 glycosyltransferase family 4 protein [Pedobacter sp. MC2016-15]
MNKIKLARITTIPLSLEVLLKGQLKYLSQYYDVLAVSSPGDKLEIVKEREGVKVSVVKMEREISLFKDIISLWKLFRLFKLERPNIVHSNTPKSSLLSMVAAYLSGVPFRIYTVTGLRFETEEGIKKSILIAMERLTCFFSTHVVAESLGVQMMIAEYKLSNKSSYIIGNGNINGLDEEYWNPYLPQFLNNTALIKELGLSPDHFIFIFVGRLVGDKGVNELIKAFSGLNNDKFKLLLLGETEQKLDALEQGVVDEIFNNKNILPLGFQADIRPYLAISHSLVLPSYREGFPNVILQAAAMRLPCIVTDVHGAAEVIDKRNGIVIKKRDINSLALALNNMYVSYEEFDKDYCRNKVVNAYSQTFYFPQLVSFYNGLSN